MKKDIAPISGPGVRFRLYGATEMVVDEQSLDTGPPKQRALLGALLLARSEPVDRDLLMEWLWDEPQPRGALTEFYKVVAATRKMLGEVGLDLSRKGNLYRLVVPWEHVDVHVFHANVERAVELGGTDDRQAAKLLREALDLARGNLMADLSGHRVDGLRHRLNEERHAAARRMEEISLRLGRHHDRIGTLSAEHARRPDDEAMAGLLMTALYRAGRQREAQEIYHRVRRHLKDSLAVDSLRQLDDLYGRMIDQDPKLDPPAEEPPIATPQNGKDSAHAESQDDRPPRQGAKAAKQDVHIEFHRKVVAPGSVFGISNTF